MAQELGIENQIKFLGYRTDISKLMKSSNLAVSTAKQEGLPLNVVEAMVCGIPCVVTINRGHKELIEDNTNGFLIEINDEKELAKKILAIYQNPKLTNKFTEKGKEKVEKFLLKNAKKEMIDIYEGLQK